MQDSPLAEAEHKIIYCLGTKALVSKGIRYPCSFSREYVCINRKKAYHLESKLAIMKLKQSGENLYKQRNMLINLMIRKRTYLD